jgi:hypothetical protein
VTFPNNPEALDPKDIEAILTDKVLQTLAAGENTG